MIDLDVVGEDLIRLGWRQGSVLKITSAQKSWLGLNSLVEFSQHSTSLNAVNSWRLKQETLDTGDFLVIATQTCDIQRSSKLEPYVEVLRAYWTSEKSSIHEAGMNSVRRFLIQRRTSDSGQMEGLIADATVRIQIEKGSLLGLTPLANFEENDKITSRRFRRWLARRYDRPAIPDELVVALQKPLIKAIGKLHPTDDKHRILAGIREILYFPLSKTAPFLIDILFIRDERNNAPAVNVEDGAKLAGWMSEILGKSGNAVLDHWNIYSLREISVHDYIHAYELPTDQYSLDDDNTND